MALQVGTVDGYMNIVPQIMVFVNAIDDFAKNGVTYAKSKGISFGIAFQRYTHPVYSGKSSTFTKTSIDIRVVTKSGKEQSPAYATFCRKMGLLMVDESKAQFELTPLAKLLLDGIITLPEYAFVISSKQGIFQDGTYKAPLFSFIYNWFSKNSSITALEFENNILSLYGETKLEKTRCDILLGALAASGLLVKNRDSYYIGGLKEAKIIEDIWKNIGKFSPAILDDDSNYTSYMGECRYGIFDILSPSNLKVYEELFPNLVKYASLHSSLIPVPYRLDNDYQVIYYGAPGTGKSHEIVGLIKNFKINEKTNVFRTTFHPDSDYSTFVGAYKPTKDAAGSITYDFVPQTFLRAYIQAYNDPANDVVLIIEEINRGNCAQIFGDLFQLLDRKNGRSEYPIKADNDILRYFKNAVDENGDKVLCNPDGYANDELCLPANLYIWATMNTSDQSLFPIDSAFKRRWDWKYIKITQPQDTDKDKFSEWQLEDGTKWWSFLQQINKIIASMTSSADKQLGFFFTKPDKDNVISNKRFVNKVVFYLWNDVFKDYAMDEGELFKFTQKDKDGKELETRDLTYPDFFDDETGKEKNDVINQFIKHVMEWESDKKHED